MEYVITDDTKGCLHCGQLFEAKRASMVFCTDKCKSDYNNLKVEKRYLNPPIVNRKELEHGDLYTSHGQEMQLGNGVLRVRLRFEDPAKKKVEQDKGDKSQENGRSHERHHTPAKRRGA